MLQGKQLIDKLYEQPKLFKEFMKNRQYSMAKMCRDGVCTVLLFLEAGEEMMQEFFGERGERGVFLRKGLFDEEQVQKAYWECIHKGDTYENKKYEPWDKHSYRT